MSNCVCESGIGNLGTPKCSKLMGRPYKMVFTQLKDSTGALNKIPAGTNIDDVYVGGFVANPDDSVRWYPTPEVKNFISTKADNVFQSFDDGTRQPLREGVRNFTGMFSQADNKFLCELDKIKCAKAGFYIVTDKNNYVGYDKDGSGDVYPIPVDVLDNVFNFTGADALQNVEFTLDIPLVVLDCKLATLYDNSADLVGLEGLFGLSAVASNAVAGGFTITIKGGGVYGNTEPYTGATISDFDVFNVTQASSTTVATLVESASGVYELTFTGAVSSDVIEVKPSTVLLSAGFDFEKVSLAVL